MTRLRWYHSPVVLRATNLRSQEDRSRSGFIFRRWTSSSGRFALLILIMFGRPIVRAVARWATRWASGSSSSVIAFDAGVSAASSRGASLPSPGSSCAAGFAAEHAMRW